VVDRGMGVGPVMSRGKEKEKGRNIQGQQGDIPCGVPIGTAHRMEDL
jgi:hypothetical protein